MTEAEAKTKWCPFARALGTLTKVGGSTEEVVTAHGPQNRGYALGGALHNCLCIGSACMAWRWIDRTYSREIELWSKSKGIRVHSAFSDDGEWRPSEGEPTEPPAAIGYCGLAGKP